MNDQPDNVIPITSDARSAVERFRVEHDRELLTILFTDLVDSTKLQPELGNVETARLTELHRKIVLDELAKYDAREIEWAGVCVWRCSTALARRHEGHERSWTGFTG